LTNLLLPILLLVAVSDIDYYVGYPTFDEQWLILILFTALGHAYKRFSLLLVSMGVAMWFAYPYLTEYANYHKTLLNIISIPLCLLVVHSCFKTSGKAFGIILMCFFAFPLWTDRNYLDIISHIVIDNTAMLGMSMSIMCGIVFLFVLAGQFLVRFGIIDYVIRLILRHVKSPGRVAILSSAVFGSVSGSAVANVMSTGQLTIPLMIQCGYKKHKAAAYEAVASTGGQLMPPVMGAAAFLMAEILQVSYWTVALSALVPAVLFYIVLFYSVPKGRGLYTGKHDEIKSKLIPLADSMFGLIILSAAIGLIIGIMDQTGLSFHITSILNVISGGNTFFLLTLVAILCIILGMGMPTSSTYLIVAIVAAPTLVDAGITEIWAHMFVLYFGVLSMITPPVALSSFTAAKIAGANPIRTSISSMFISWPLYIMPFIFVWF
jgi:TRAP-type uncharacterized transport system fused permease subunit